MANVVAKVRGYFGSVLREPGDRFHIDDEIMDDPKRRPKWVEAASAAASPDVVDNADGESVGGEGEGEPKTAKGKGRAKVAPPKAGRKAKPETIQAPEAQPFGDAPAPVRVKNEINDALGSTQPDWIAPGAPVAVAD